ncbi:hypothetical protein ACI3KY_02795 [Microbacterium sp. ZW T2_14]|uniref:hypothetical protein n=1 Tax=Microbacterium sp. ZW T2_14 TaxID=3378079 RepID=UPI003854B4D9
MTYSPNRHFRLEALDGDPGDIQAAGESYTLIGQRMEWTSGELKKLSSEERYKAEGLDAIREDAGELSHLLGQVAKRYTASGPVLVTYAGALLTAQTRTVNPLIDDIWTAIDRHNAAVEARQDAEGTADDLRNPWPWQDEATDQQLANADDAVSDARHSEGLREGELDGLWTSFESGYGVWEDAYEAAVRDLESAYTTSGIDDNPWEDAFDFLAQALTVIGTILVIAALIATGPLAVFLLVAATVAAVLTLVIHIGMMVAGSKRVAIWDLVFDVVAVLPFAGGVFKAMRGGGMAFFPALRAAAGMGTATESVIGAGRNAVEDGLRTIAGAGGVRGGQAARASRATDLADDFLQSSIGNWGQGAWNAIRAGGARLDGQALSLSERIFTAWPTSGVPRVAATTWVETVDAAGRIAQGVNVLNFVNGVEQSTSAVAGWFGGELPTVSDLPLLDFNPFAR